MLKVALSKDAYKCGVQALSAYVVQESENVEVKKGLSVLIAYLYLLYKCCFNFRYLTGPPSFHSLE